MRDPTDLLDFVRRDWSAAERSKAIYWRDWKRRHGLAAGLRIADELRRQVLRMKPGWPSGA